MKVTVKKRGSSDMYTFEVNGEQMSFTDFKPLLTEVYGSNDYTVKLGETSLSSLDPSLTLSAMGVVSGDRLFLDPSTDHATASGSAPSLPPSIASHSHSIVTAPVSAQPTRQSTLPPTSEQSTSNVRRISSADFKAEIISVCRSIMKRFSYEEHSLNTGRMAGRLFVELGFEPEQKSHLIGAMTGCCLTIYVFEHEVKAGITSYVIDDKQQHHIVSCWEVRPDDYHQSISAGLVRLTLYMRDRLTLPVILSLPPVRDLVLSHLAPREASRLSGTSMHLKHIITQKDVDNKYWKKALNRDFGESVNRTFVMRKYLTSYNMYCMLANKRCSSQLEADYPDRRLHPRPRPTNDSPRFPNMHVPPTVPNYPDHPDLSPFRPGGMPPDIRNPYAEPLRQGFRLPEDPLARDLDDLGRADLNPFADGGGMLLPDPGRGGRRGDGQPRQIGRGFGRFGGSGGGFSGFDGFA